MALADCRLGSARRFERALSQGAGHINSGPWLSALTLQCAAIWLLTRRWFSPLSFRDVTERQQVAGKALQLQRLALSSPDIGGNVRRTAGQYRVLQSPHALCPALWWGFLFESREKGSGGAIPSAGKSFVVKLSRGELVNGRHRWHGNFRGKHHSSAD